jgi:phosphatidylethanolamine-binding protein (PEBP) family uncharacterized protein
MNYKKGIIVLFFSISLVLFAETKSIENILKDYNSTELTSVEASEIMEFLKAAGYIPGPDLDKLIDNQGFDSLKLRELAPPPPKNKNENINRAKDGHKHKTNSGKIYSTLDLNFKKSNFVLTSSAIVNGELLEKFKGEKKIKGVEESIPLKWKNVPEGTTSLAIIMYHYPRVGDKTIVNSYLLLWDIKPSVTEIKHGDADNGPWFMGANKDGKVISYTSPNSPSAGEHIYHISIFALTQPLTTLPKKSSLAVDFDVFMNAIESNKIIGKADLTFKDINL